MKKKIAAVAIAGTGLVLAACNHTPGASVATGALVGGAAGAGIGQIVGGTTAATLTGAAIGAGTGAVVGAAAEQRRVCTAYDEYGRAYQYYC